jgi:hypothetical protein
VKNPSKIQDQLDAELRTAIHFAKQFDEVWKLMGLSPLDHDLTVPRKEDNRVVSGDDAAKTHLP